MRINLIDGNYEINRAAHKALEANLTNQEGKFTGGLFYFLKQLYNIVNVGTPVVILDGGHSKVRKQIDPEYKANRKKEEIPEDMKTFEDIKKEQTFKLIFDTVPKLLPMMGIPVIRMRGEEADDVIYKLAKRLKNSGVAMTVTSDDHDYLQNLENDVEVFKARKKVVYTKQSFIDEFGYDPSIISLIKAITGDDKDNVIGIKGIGDKTALKILKNIEPNYTLDALEEWSKSGEHKHQVIIRENMENIRKNFKLKDLNTSPVDDDEVFKAYVEAKRSAKPELNKVLEVFNELEFHSLSNWVVYVSSRNK